MDLAKQKKCDGVEPDNVDAFDNGSAVGVGHRTLEGAFCCVWSVDVLQCAFSLIGVFTVKSVKSNGDRVYGGKVTADMQLTYNKYEAFMLSCSLFVRVLPPSSLSWLSLPFVGGWRRMPIRWVFPL